jgi:hypothetical protein
MVMATRFYWGKGRGVTYPKDAVQGSGGARRGGGGGPSTVSVVQGRACPDLTEVWFRPGLGWGRMGMVAIQLERRGTVGVLGAGGRLLLPPCMAPPPSMHLGSYQGRQLPPVNK